jgi:hypothetical protein
MRHTHFAAAMVTAVIVMAGAVALHATERRPLPPFMLTSLDGQPVASTELALEGNWLLIYVEPSCGSCMAILRAMPREEFPGLAARVTVVVAAASPAQASAVAAAATELGEARWFMDPDRSAGKMLGFKHSPVVLGVRAAMIEWGVTGVLRKSDEMQSVLVSWLTQRRP